MAAAYLAPNAIATVVVGTAPYMRSNDTIVHFGTGATVPHTEPSRGFTTHNLKTSNSTSTVYKPTTALPPYTSKNGSHTSTTTVHSTGVVTENAVTTSSVPPFPLHNTTSEHAGIKTGGTAVTRSTMAPSGSVGTTVVTETNFVTTTQTHGSTFTPGRHAKVKTDVVTSSGSVITLPSFVKPFPMLNTSSVFPQGSFTGLTGSHYVTGSVGSTGTAVSTATGVSSTLTGYSTDIPGTETSTRRPSRTSTITESPTVTIVSYCDTCPPVAPGLPATNTTLTVQTVCPTCPPQTVASSVTGVSTALTVTHACPTCPPIIVVPASATSVPAFAAHCPVCPVNMAIASASSCSSVAVNTPNAANEAAASSASVVAASAAQSAASEADNTASAASAYCVQASATAAVASSSASAAASLAAATPNPSNAAKASTAQSIASSLSEAAEVASTSAVAAESSAAVVSAVASSAGAPSAAPAETTPASGPTQVLTEAPTEAPTGSPKSNVPFTGAATVGSQVSSAIFALGLVACLLL